MNKKTILFLIIGVLLVTTLSVLFLAGKEKRSKNGNGEIESSYSEIENNKNENSRSDCVSDYSPLFTEPFTDLSKVQSLGILGSVTGGSPGRSYVSVKKGEKVPVYNPTDAVLETIVWADRGGGHPEYGFYFKASCEVTYLLDHVDNISDKLKKLAPENPSPSTASQFGSQPNAIIKAGELLGYTNGTAQAQTFDFMLINKSKPVFHVNPKRWKWEQAVYADCPYDYYEENLKKQHYELLGTTVEGGKLLKAENCGSPSQDVTGTVSGGWFQPNSNTGKGRWVVFGQQFSWMEMGIQGNGSNKIFALKEFDPKITPNKIIPGQSVCFQGYQNNWAYVKLLSDKQLLLATGSGQCPTILPENKAETWER